MKFLLAILTLLTFSIGIHAQKDVIPTENGDVVMTPVLHATTVLEWNGKTIYMDPYGGAEGFEGFENGDVICITHAHGDHMNIETLKGLDLSSTIAIVPQSVADELGEVKFKEVKVLANDESVKIDGVTITAFPMYNLPDDETSRHKKGWGNAYILTIGGKTFYLYKKLVLMKHPNGSSSSSSSSPAASSSVSSGGNN